MIEPHERGPIGRDVATLTLHGKLSLVHVIVGMTSAALPRKLVFYVTFVAGVAGKLFVPRRKREIGSRRMVKCHAGPVRRDVAAAAIIPVLAFVYVVRAMAAYAIAVTEIEKILGAMTVLAAEAAVSAVQRESGHCQVVECEILPVRGVVALCTLSTVASAMNVVVFVARIAGSSNL